MMSRIARLGELLRTAVSKLNDESPRDSNSFWASSSQDRVASEVRSWAQLAGPQLAEERQLLTAPLVFVTPGAASFTENGPPVTVDPGINVVDPDGSLITSAEVKITNFTMGADQLLFTDQLGITGSFDSNTGILTLTGLANESDYATALSTIQYNNTSDGPAPLTKTIQFTVTDDLDTSTPVTRDVTITPLADTPTVTDAVMDEDTLSNNGLVILPLPQDGVETSHFQITNITNGTLYQNDGVTEINNGEFITIAQGAAGLRFQPNLNYFGNASFDVQASIGNNVSGLGGSKVTANITVNPVADTPSVTGTVMDEDTLSNTGLVITPNPVDGASVTYFQITNITNGTLYHNDGVTQINNGDFITVADGAAGLRFQPNLNYFGNASFEIQASISNGVSGLGGSKITANITVNPVADTPTVTDSTTDEDTLSNMGLVITPNPVDGATVTHFQITDITNGTLYLNDGVTQINNNDFITVAQAAAGLKFLPNPNYFGVGTFDIQASIGNEVSGLGGSVITANITVNPIADTPSVTNATTNEDTLSMTGLVITPNPVDGVTVTHFQITNITNGTLYQNDGVTQINNGDFITVAQGAAGLKFLPNANYFGMGTFDIQASIGNAVVGLNGAVITAKITVNPIADTPSVTNAVTDEDVITMSGLVITPNPVDGIEVTHYQITNITNGTLYLNDGVTQINNNDFITVAQGAAGLKFLPNANFYGNGSFDIQASIGNSLTGLGGSKITATITVNPIADTPSVTNSTTNEDTITTSGLVITPNPVDGITVTHYQITNITNGTLYLNDGVTVINNNDFITVAQGAAGLKFLPNANFFGNGSFDIQASIGNAVIGLAGAVITAKITVNPIADTPSVTNAVTNEDTITTSGLVITPNPVDDVTVTHFQITNITNGTLYLNDGVTVINNGDFITVAQGAAGLKFLPNPNFYGNGTFDIQASIGSNVTGLGGSKITATITVNPIADTPSVTDSVTDEDTLSTTGLVITPNPVDGITVTHYQITNITNGTLYLNDGVTVINNGDFITVAQGAAGLKFLPNLNFFGNGSFKIQASIGNAVMGLGGAVITAHIKVNPVNDAPVITPPGNMAMTNEDTSLAFSSGNGLLITLGDVDVFGGQMTLNLSVTHGKLLLGNTTGLTFLSGTTNGSANVIVRGTIADLNNALASLVYTPNQDYFGPDSLVVFVDDLGNSGSGGIKNDNVAIPITVKPVNDPPVLTVPGDQTTPESTTLVFSNANGNAISFLDVDAFNLPQTITLSTTHGTLTLGSTSGISFVVGANGTSSMTIKGTLTDLNNALQGLKFLHFDNATATISVKVTDDMLAMVSGNIKVTVTNVAPTPSIAGATTGLEGTPVALTASATDPANPPVAPATNDPITFTWVVTKDGNAYTNGVGANINFLPTDQGVYTVTLTADDGDGGITVTQHVVNVANVAPTSVIIATDVNGQFYTYVNVTTNDPGNDSITITVDWSDILPNGVYYDPFGSGEMPDPRVFPEFSHRYLVAPNPQDPLAPITITFYIFDGTDTVIQQVVVDVTEQGVPSAGVYITPEPEKIQLPVTQSTIVQVITPSTPTQATQEYEDRSTRIETKTEENRLLVLRIVLADGTESDNILLPDRALTDLPALFKRLPDNHYRVYLIQNQHLRLVVDVVVRQGRAIDPNDVNTGAQDRPPMKNEEAPQQGAPNGAAPNQAPMNQAPNQQIPNNPAPLNNDNNQKINQNRPLEALPQLSAAGLDAVRALMNDIDASKSSNDPQSAEFASNRASSGSIDSDSATIFVGAAALAIAAPTIESIFSRRTRKLRDRQKTSALEKEKDRKKNESGVSNRLSRLIDRVSASRRNK